MAAKDFQELIKAQQETTKALMSAEEAARYDAILTERKMTFDKKSESVKAGLEAKNANDSSILIYSSPRHDKSFGHNKSINSEVHLGNKRLSQVRDKIITP